MPQDEILERRISCFCSIKEITRLHLCRQKEKKRAIENNPSLEMRNITLAFLKTLRWHVQPLLCCLWTHLKTWFVLPKIGHGGVVFWAHPPKCWQICLISLHSVRAFSVYVWKSPSFRIGHIPFKWKEWILLKVLYGCSRQLSCFWGPCAQLTPELCSYL